MTCSTISVVAPYLRQLYRRDGCSLSELLGSRNSNISCASFVPHKTDEVVLRQLSSEASGLRVTATSMPYDSVSPVRWIRIDWNWHS